MIVRWHNKWTEPWVKTRYSGKKLTEANDIHLKSASLTRKAVKYALLSLFLVITLTYLPLLEYVPYVVSFHFFSPEYNTALYDYFIRTFIYRFFSLLPIVLCLVAGVIVLLPRLEDLSTSIQLKLHLTGPKQSEISKELWAGSVKVVVSKTFIGSIVLMFLPILLMRFVLSLYINSTYVVYVASMASALGVYFGLKLAVLLFGTFERLPIGGYASRHFMLGSLVSLLTLVPVVGAVVYVVVAFNVSSYYLHFLDSVFFSQVRLFQPFSLLASSTFTQDLPILAAVFVVGAVLIIFLFTFIIPFLCRMTAKEILSALIVFVIDRSCALGWNLRGYLCAVICLCASLGSSDCGRVAQALQEKSRKNHNNIAWTRWLIMLCIDRSENHGRRHKLSAVVTFSSNH
jgi:hypothetical protein